MYEVPSMPDVEKVIITADTVNKKEPPTYIRRENIDEPVKRPIQASGLAWGGKMLVVICSDIPVSDHVMKGVYLWKRLVKLLRYCACWFWWESRLLIVCDVLFIRKNVTYIYGDILYSTWERKKGERERFVWKQVWRYREGKGEVWKQ